MFVRFLSAGFEYLKAQSFEPAALILSSNPSPSRKVVIVPFALASSDGLAVFILESLNLSLPVSRLFFSTVTITPLSTIELSTTNRVVLIIVLAKLVLGDYLGLFRTTKNPQSLMLCGFLVFLVPTRNIIWWSWGDLNPRPKLLHPRYYMLSHSLHSPTRCGETRHELTSSIGFNASAPSRTSTRSCEG